MFIFTTDSFASGIGTTPTAPCDNATLSKYTGTVNAEINWEPNEIQLGWYDGNTKLDVPVSAQSCTYDGMITVPPQPTKLGYTFNGWKVIPVPGGCKKIEYLESNGSQYINTGYSAPNGFKAQVGLFFYELIDMCVIGAHDYPAPAKRNYLKIRNDGYWKRFEIGAGAYYVSGYVIHENVRYDIEFSTIKDNIFLTGDNDLKCLGNDGDTGRSSLPLYLFCINWNGGTSMPFSGKIYYAKIYDENGTMVRDFIPILDKNNVPCMWDKITGQFFYNAGTGAFTAGPVAQ